ncbi:MAG: KamA family radical SAM protein [Spirochaetales bacterium]|nr:KamA family radical SAM protein [Spirochaetales bacterium]
MMDKVVTSGEKLNNYLSLSKEEKAFFEECERKGNQSLPLHVPLSWLERIEGEDCPLRKQSVPHINEFTSTGEELLDPIGDRRHSPLKGLIHHYDDRVLVLITDRCAMYCRHCFRRHFTGRGGALKESEIDSILDYLEEHKEVHEVIISGGDALMAPYNRLEYLLNGLNDLKRPLVKRVGTRLPLVYPDIISERILNLLGAQKSLWLVMQINHVKELSPAAIGIIQEIRKRGIPMLNQAVLLKGVNDSVEAQINLSYALIEEGIKPYYLFQGDLAKGTSHFRVPLDRALELYEELGKRVSHLALPRFGLDLPGGGGKVNLEASSMVRKDEEYYYFRNGKGQVGRYPREEE